MKDSCLFCSLLAENKLNLVYQDDQVVAFPDIEPKAPVHILIIPREHIASVADADTSHEAVLGHLFIVARQIAEEQGLSEKGYRLVVNTKEHAGQTVHHIHMHLLGGQQLGDISSIVTA